MPDNPAVKLCNLTPPLKSQNEETHARPQFSFVPGPTNVPDRVMRAMMVAMEDHRSPRFPRAGAAVAVRPQGHLQDHGGAEPSSSPSTGTGAWEASLTNTLSPGDKVLASRYGQFSHLWIDMAKRLGLDVQVLEEEWGTGVDPDRVEAVLRADTAHAIKAVMAVHNETTTGVTSDIGALRRVMDAAKHPAMLYIDGVSSIASLDFRFDEWRVDLAVTGSQKGLMMPAGRHPLRQPAGRCGLPNGRVAGACFLISRHDQGQRDRLFSLHAGPPDALRTARIPCHDLRGNAGDVIQRHHVLAGGVRAAVKAWGLDLCAKEQQWTPIL